MSISIQINGTRSLNSLVHKGSISVSTATLPDVCKTPSPGGPVPVPYPNISFSKDLANGTKTVTADGGNMIAIKGSEYSSSIGDEPGTAGGVKSSTNMKESKWITYSFDVKMDGQNACRLSDKKTQNHANTVDAMGDIQAVVPADTCDLEIDCEEKKNDKRPGKKWDDCMVEELCKMIEDFNKVPNEKKKRVSPSPSSVESEHNGTYTSVKNTFASNFSEAVTEGTQSEAWIKGQFGSDCRYQKWVKGEPPPPRNPNPPRSGEDAMHPDHTHDVGLGGPFDDVNALKWVKGLVNTTAGGAMRAYDPKKHKKVMASKCCD